MPVEWLDALQWPAMAVTVAAAWCVGSSRERRRAFGFWLFVASNVLWVVWGWHTSAWALVLLQFALAALNWRGARKNEDAQAGPAGSAGSASATDAGR